LWKETRSEKTGWNIIEEYYSSHKPELFEVSIAIVFAKL